MTMNISLTRELEDYIKDQVKTGHYKSNSEVIREALRGKIHTEMEKTGSAPCRIYAAGSQW
ncbi:MAG: putative addiction module CopG family antidote [Parasphingorhabdus sp.]|jgi:putative addiction module CopG family antidote